MKSAAESVPFLGTDECVGVEGGLYAVLQRPSMTEAAVKD